jgi:tetratricopeptide (TPR) repeat protein
MKLTMKLFLLLFSVLMLLNAASADSPREQLKQMVEQLQKSPSDNSLREKIIKLAQKLKPAPAVPDEAERRMARGTAAFKGAKTVSDYQEAVKEFEQATLAAPWYGDAYFNLGVAQDKAENYGAALRSLKLAQLTSPGSKEIKQLIYEVEYRNEKAHSPSVVAAKQATSHVNSDEELVKSLDGAVFVDRWDTRAQQGEILYKISGRSVILTNHFLSGGGDNACGNPYQNIRVGQSCSDYPTPLNGRHFVCQGLDCEISPDGQSIVQHWSNGAVADTYPRQ